MSATINLIHPAYRDDARAQAFADVLASHGIDAEKIDSGYAWECEIPDTACWESEGSKLAAHLASL